MIRLIAPCGQAVSQVCSDVVDRRRLIARAVQPRFYGLSRNTVDPMTQEAQARRILIRPVRDQLHLWVFLPYLLEQGLLVRRERGNKLLLGVVLQRLDILGQL